MQAEQRPGQEPRERPPCLCCMCQYSFEWSMRRKKRSQKIWKSYLNDNLIYMTMSHVMTWHVYMTMYMSHMTRSHPKELPKTSFQALRTFSYPLHPEVWQGSFHKQKKVTQTCGLSGPAICSPNYIPPPSIPTPLTSAQKCILHLIEQMEKRYLRLYRLYQLNTTAAGLTKVYA